MTIWVAFLRGVNLGKRQMRMAELKSCCESLGLTQVKTILASGNVRFEIAEAQGLRQRLEVGLRQAFDFPVEVVLRSADELEAMIASEPFRGVDPNADVALHVLLADSALGQPEFGELPAHLELARVDARDIYIVAHRLPNGRYTEGMEAIGKALPTGLLVTMRNWNTMLKVLR